MRMHVSIPIGKKDLIVCMYSYEYTYYALHNNNAAINKNKFFNTIIHT